MASHRSRPAPPIHRCAGRRDMNDSPRGCRCRFRLIWGIFGSPPRARRTASHSRQEGLVSMRTSRLLAGLAFLLVALAGGGWYGYAVWWPGHCLDRLTRCPPDEAERWVERVARFGDGV